MAEKRMFAKKITDSDAFIELSSSAQALYFHLNQGADDDGFNNQVQNAIFKSHSTIDDLKVLMAKNFIIRFANGVIVIKHWRMHNTLRKDRYTPTNYQEELKALGIKENGAYTVDDIDSIPAVDMVAKWLPNGCQTVATEKIREDKRRIDKIREEEDKEEEKIFIIVKIFNDRSGLHPIEKLTEARKEKIISLLRDYGMKEICRAIEICSKSQWLLKQKDWYANFDWFFKQDNFVKVLEGKFLEEKQRKDDKRLTKDVPDWYQEYEDKIKEASSVVVSEEEKAKALKEVLATNLFECSKTVKEEGN